MLGVADVRDFKQSIHPLRITGDVVCTPNPEQPDLSQRPVVVDASTASDQNRSSHRIDDRTALVRFSISELRSPARYFRFP